VDQGLSQEERFGRLERFTCEMEELELLNPYSVTDILKAEKRFSGLNSGKSSRWDPLSSMKKLAS
jgi:hypothetical protein